MADGRISPTLPGSAYLPKPSTHETDPRERRQRDAKRKRRRGRKPPKDPADDERGADEGGDEPGAGPARPEGDGEAEEVEHVDIRAAHCRTNGGLATTWMFLPVEAVTPASRPAERC